MADPISRHPSFTAHVAAVMTRNQMGKLLHLPLQLLRFSQREGERSYGAGKTLACTLLLKVIELLVMVMTCQQLMSPGQSARERTTWGAHHLSPCHVVLMQDRSCSGFRQAMILIRCTAVVLTRIIRLCFRRYVDSAQPQHRR